LYEEAVNPESAKDFVRYRDLPSATLLSSAALTAGTVICVGANAVVSAVEGSPTIDASQETEIHRETSPQPIVNDAGVVSYPVASLFQTDTVGLRLRWDISWALRASGGMAFMTGVNW
jgi:hypothetical protein